MSFDWIWNGFILGGTLSIIVSVFIYTTFYDNLTGEWKFGRKTNSKTNKQQSKPGVEQE